jgi:hypothetical protein
MEAAAPTAMKRADAHVHAPGGAIAASQSMPASEPMGRRLWARKSPRTKKKAPRAPEASPAVQVAER